MKSNIKANSTKVTLFATVLLATCLFASSANAQSAFEGKFTLAQQAYWGHGGLPAGDYLLSVTTTGSPAMVIIRDAGNGKEVAMVAAQTREASTTGGSALFIGRRGKRRVIYSFRVYHRHCAIQLGAGSLKPDRFRLLIVLRPRRIHSGMEFFAAFATKPRP
jgi:hypothetical protein